MAEQFEERVLQLLDVVSVELVALRTTVDGHGNMITALRADMNLGFNRVERRLGNIEGRLEEFEDRVRSLEDRPSL